MLKSLFYFLWANRYNHKDAVQRKQKLKSHRWSRWAKYTNRYLCRCTETCQEFMLQTENNHTKPKNYQTFQTKRIIRYNIKIYWWFYLHQLLLIKKKSLLGHIDNHQWDSKPAKSSFLQLSAADSGHNSCWFDVTNRGVPQNHFSSKILKPSV